MTVTALSVSAATPASQIAGLDRVIRDEPVLAGLTLLLVAAMAPTLFAALVDGRLVSGENPWIKPLRFEIALAIYTGTLAVFARWLLAGTVGRRHYRWFRNLVVAAIVAEMVWIGAAAALGTVSHFNQTGLGAVLYPLMGIAAVILTSLSTVYAWLIARNGKTCLAPVVKDSIVVGLALTLPLTLATAGTLASVGQPTVHVEGVFEGPLGFLGWAREGGGLRAAHFLATHAMHAIPLAGVVALALLGPQARSTLRVVALLYGAAVLSVLAVSLQG